VVTAPCQGDTEGIQKRTVRDMHGVHGQTLCGRWPLRPCGF
jgi:hypothetical protein